MDWIYLAQVGGPVLGCCKRSNEHTPFNTALFKTTCTSISPYRQMVFLPIWSSDCVVLGQDSIPVPEYYIICYIMQLQYFNQ